MERQVDPPTEVPEGIKRKGDKVIRTRETGDKVYLVTGNMVQWVKTLETLTALGWKLGQEQFVSLDELRKYEMGEPLGLDTVETGVGVAMIEEVSPANVYQVPVVGKSAVKNPVLRYRKSA